MDSSDFQISADVANLKLPRLHKLKRPRTNYFKEKDRSESIPLKVSIKEEFKISRGKSKDYVKIINSKLTEIDYLNAIEDAPIKDLNKFNAKPSTKNIAEWSKRIFYNKRPEMAMKNLIIFVFDGVIGDCFKKNIWEEGAVKLFFRRGVIKELKKLIDDFQVVIFFVSEDIKPRKILKYLTSKDIAFDAAYKSRNTSKYNFSIKSSKKISKKPLKYSEFFQDYSQVFIDFGLQHEVSEKILIVTSISLSPEDLESKGEDLLYHSTSQYIISYLW